MVATISWSSDSVTVPAPSSPGSSACATSTIRGSACSSVAGTGLGYVFYTSNNMMQNVPTLPAFDTMTVTFVLVMVIVASLISAAIASRGIVKQRVTQILRGA